MEIKPKRQALIVGCGYLGRALAKELIAANIAVIATTRSPENLPTLAALRVQPLLFDALSSTPSELPTVDLAFITLAPDDSTPDAYDRTYGQAVPRVARLVHARHLVYTSSTGVFGHGASGRIDETFSLKIKSPKQRALLAAETAVREVGGTVVRLAGIYGPGRNRIQDIRAGRLEPCDSETMANLIHVEDAARACLFLGEQNPHNEVFLGVDTEPVRRLHMYDWISKQIGVSLSFDSHRKAAHKRTAAYSSEKLKRLGFTFRFPTFREGYRAIIAAEI